LTINSSLDFRHTYILFRYIGLLFCNISIYKETVTDKTKAEYHKNCYYCWDGYGYAISCKSVFAVEWGYRSL